MLIKSKQLNPHHIHRKDFPKFESNLSANSNANPFFDGEDSTINNVPTTNKKAGLENELQKVKEISFKEGYENGEQAGYEKGLQSIQQNVEQFGALINKIQAQQEEVIADSEKFIINFALKIVEKIMGSDEISRVLIDEKKLHSIVEEALNQFPESTKYILRVHKDTSEFLEQYKPQLLEKLSRPAALSVIEDPSLKPGECLVESEHGVIDARINSQIEEIKNVFVKKDVSEHND